MGERGFDAEMGGEMAVNTFQIPYLIADELMPLLRPAEMKVVVYLCRQMFCWDRPQRGVPAEQVAHGHLSAEGRRLDWGTGLEAAEVREQLLELQRFGVVAESAGEWGLATDFNDIDVSGLEARRRVLRSENADSERRRAE